MNTKGELPVWAWDYACAVVRGYDARLRYMSRCSGSEGNKVYRLYSRLNGCVDKAFDEVCEEGERQWIWLSIVDGMSWERATGCPCGRRRYYELRGAVVDKLAQLLNIY